MTPDHLTALIDALHAERSVIDERLRLANELLATYGDPLAETTIPLEDEVRIVGKKPKVKPAKPKGERVACPDCGQMFFEQGMGVHRSRKHPQSAAKPVRLVEADRDPLDDFGDDVYSCTSCNHEEPNEAGIRGHTMRLHNRPATSEERQAVAS